MSSTTTTTTRTTTSLIIVWIVALLGIFVSLGLNRFGEGSEQFKKKWSEPLINFAHQSIEKGYVPEIFIRWGIRYILQDRYQEMDYHKQNPNYVKEFVEDLKQRTIAEYTTTANDQHYEIDIDFYKYILGNYNKYSCSLFLPAEATFDQMHLPPNITKLIDPVQELNRAEIKMMEMYLEKAKLCTGSNCNLKVLDLGCGWGSFTFFYAERCPGCIITSISNSESQIQYIRNEAKKRGIKNIQAFRIDINNLNKETLSAQNILLDKIEFDRIISIEMFEHVKNYDLLLSNLYSLLHQNSWLFVHMFVQKNFPYHFLVESERDWMAKYFFTGGTMASHKMLSYFNDKFEMKENYQVNGMHYYYTAECWLHNFRTNSSAIRNSLAKIYGISSKEKSDPENNTIVELWYNRWKTFFLGVSELFRVDSGNEWFVGIYILQPKKLLNN